jgi:hypothetical protein
MYQIPEVHNDLERTLWCFVEIGNTIYLEEMRPQTRKTKRHGWSSDSKDCYARLSHTSRGCGVKEEPEVPFGIQADAVDHFRQQIKFEIWKDRR